MKWGESTRLAQGVAESQTGSPQRRGACREKPNPHGGAHGERCLLLAASGLLARGFFLWCFCYDQVVGLANEGFKFIEGEDVGVCQEDPFVTANIWSGGDAFDFN